MRKYRVYYYIEKYDECVDCEKEIEAACFENVYYIFREQVKVFKRIYKVEEI